jgi:hypothetical protein
MTVLGRHPGKRYFVSFIKPPSANLAATQFAQSSSA